MICYNILAISLSLFTQSYHYCKAWPTSTSRISNHNINVAIKTESQVFQREIDLQINISRMNSIDLTYTRANGQPYSDPAATLRLGENGPLLLQDHHLIENLAHFVRERIPERVVHAKGAGAHGIFTVTTDFAKQHTMMDVFSEVGKKTPISIRFSTVGGEQGSADEARDPRFRTQKGIWDLIMNNTPVFFIRDPAKFSTFIHTQKRNPRTHLKDPNMVWDYFGQNPEAMHQFLRLYSDAGTPKGFVHMNGFTGHSYRWVKADGSWVYVKLLAETDQGIQNFTALEATKIVGKNPDYATSDLFTRIESGRFPSWTLYAQILTPQEAEKFKYNNPENFFAEIEQLAFAPSNMVDGWEPSTDPVLQARLFSYPDAQRYRLGVNFQQLPVNCPMNPVANFQRDGRSVSLGNQGSRMGYISSFQSINVPSRSYDDSNHTIWTGGAIRSMSQISDIDFEQPRMYWNSLSEQDKRNLVMNLASSLSQVKYQGVVFKALQAFEKVEPALSERISHQFPSPK
ncbi:hypothetical protein CROQUDRAFT_654391 [Cronartium quercuum f. sp. fusiforme G11]|uniref:Catalase n=1 Tax=Cronartium quercuum f. sp. fusiforme G11 TaxID=708437 RepID=A0A9P6NSM8_9BASI|nr:hypothetical protein CROQUDRAFT_654391 [Cronartium quercuum f. sp. fusiforme G11]